MRGTCCCSFQQVEGEPRDSAQANRKAGEHCPQRSDATLRQLFDASAPKHAALQVTDDSRVRAVRGKLTNFQLVEERLMVLRNDKSPEEPGEHRPLRALFADLESSMSQIHKRVFEGVTMDNVGDVAREASSLFLAVDETLEAHRAEEGRKMRYLGQLFEFGMGLFTRMSTRILAVLEPEVRSQEALREVHDLLRLKCDGWRAANGLLKLDGPALVTWGKIEREERAAIERLRINSELMAVVKQQRDVLQLKVSLACWETPLSQVARARATLATCTCSALNLLTLTPPLGWRVPCF